MDLRDAATRAAFRVRHAVRPPLTVTAPPAGVRVERDVPVAVRDGAVLRVNVFRPADDGPHPVLLCAHPYGKDATPKPRRGGGGWHVPFQVRLLPQSEPYSISAWTSWEAPDPAAWVPRGYAVVNADLRGWGRSDGVGTLLSAQEADDYHDLVEWAGTQPWSNGRVGLTGVSYLAIAQWGVAATRPPHLAAISPWEGFTDAYRDFLRPGGAREDGFAIVWNAGLRAQHRSPVDIRAQQKARPCFDEWWAARVPALEAIDVPALVCASFSDHNLHSGGSFRGFDRIGSTHKWLYTHRGPKWATYYGAEAQAVQRRFFEQFLRGVDTGILTTPPVRLEVREDAATVSAVRAEAAFPPPAARWTELRLDARTGTLEGAAGAIGATTSSSGPADPDPVPAASVVLDTRRGEAVFRHRFADDTEVVGPLVVRLAVEVQGADDATVFVGLRKRRGGRVVGFEGSYGFTQALVTCGWLKVSHRELDMDRTTPDAPVHTHRSEQPVVAGQVVPLTIALLPSATRFRAGDELELAVRGRWFFPRNPLVGQFPAGYQRSPRGRLVLHTGGDHDAVLRLPLLGPEPG
jgi:predicted acyl esterase